MYGGGSAFQNQFALEKKARARAETALNKVSEALKAERVDRQQFLKRLRRALLDALTEEDLIGQSCISAVDLRIILNRFIPTPGALPERAESEKQPYLEE